ncbi:MAG: hypothetical protein NZ707_10775, partial [Rhodospirillales bacterium]|nr:hypothetical protein [Rhodospirillales bacterium]
PIAKVTLDSTISVQTLSKEAFYFVIDMVGLLQISIMGAKASIVCMKSITRRPCISCVAPLEDTDL